MIQIQDMDSEQLFEYSLLLSEGRRMDEAVKVWQEVVRLDPDHFHAHLCLGHEFFYNENYSEAILHYMTAARIIPRNALAHLGLGQSFTALHRDEEALGQFRASAYLGSPAAYFELGKCYGRLGNLPEAERYIRGWLDANPGDFEGTNALADVLYKAGRKDGARWLWESVSTVHPAGPWSRDAREKLTQFFGVQFPVS